MDYIVNGGNAVLIEGEVTVQPIAHQAWVKDSS